MSEAVLDVAALDASASAVEAEIPAIETPAEAPAEETPVEAGAEAAKTEDGKPADKAVTDTTAAPITPTKIIESLQKLKAEDPAMAKALHEHVKSNLQAQKFLKENGVKDFSELKTKLSAPDQATEEFRQSVEETDAMLYAGGEQHAALVGRILEDLTTELGDKEGPVRFSELTTNMVNKMKETDPAGYVQHQRSNFLDASEQSGLIESLNKLNGHLVAGRAAEAKALLGNVVKFFQAEIKADQDGAKARTDQQATQAKTASAAVESLRAGTTKTVNSTTNKILGSYLAPFLQKELKGLSRPELEKVAAQIYADAHMEFGKDADYVKSMNTKYTSIKTPQQQREFLRMFEEKLKSGFGQKIVENTVKRLYPDRFKTVAPKPAAPKAPASTKQTIGGVERTVFQLEKKPTNLVRSDTAVGSRVFTSKELELLLMAKGIGLVPNKSGKGHSFVQWKR